MIEVNHPIRVLVVHVINPLANKEKAVHVGEELESLIATLGAKIVDRVMQKRDNPDNATFIGKGKVEEVLGRVKELGIEVVILNSVAKPNQVSALKKVLSRANPQIDVWDRVDLILHIFDKHAQTTEAKLQIELARMKYMGPRIYGMGMILSRQGGGVGTSGIGETNTELMRRHWRKEVKRVTDQLDKIAKDREQQVERRKRSGLKTVSIVGYTNAGKSSLFNILTNKKNIVENVLFSTLDSTVGKIYMPELQSEVLITDTIGFIRNLPPKLISAFRSTLLESLHADILLHVIDVSDEEFKEKIHVVDDILIDLGRNMENIIYVFNKIDLAKDLNKEQLLDDYKYNSPIFISAKNGIGIENIKEIVVNHFIG